MSADEDPIRSRPDYFLHGFLFVATLATTTNAGANPNSVGLWEYIVSGLPFSLSLMGILTAHEMGHYMAARYHRVAASLPYFIPLPFGLLGTLGAVIKMPKSVRNRNKLVDIAAAGPISGLVIAVPILLLGLWHSPVGPMQTGGLIEGNSILYLMCKLLVKGLILPAGGMDVQLHPAAFAGWVGLLVTMINLIPIGQLDGGHLAFAYFGQPHNRASVWLHRGLLLLGLGVSAYTVWRMTQRFPLSIAFARGATTGMPWLVWWVLLHVFRKMSRGTYHPAVDDRPLTRFRRTLCIAMLMLFILILTPIPMRIAW